MLPFGVNPVGVLMAAVATFLIGMLWYSPILFAKPWMALNGYTPEKLEAMKKGAARAYGVSFLAYLVLGTGIAAIVHGGPALEGLLKGVHLWVFIVMPVSLTGLVFSDRRFGAWLIDAMYQFVYFAAMGAILSRWG
ncbi:MAG TPA: DUF1761 domain-containing protein [Gemmatimonadales bacterium]|jgi:hypothetical protein|nr:DUF1761 domain-containing protein [Gemmatimonadales bacterium]